MYTIISAKETGGNGATRTGAYSRFFFPISYRLQFFLCTMSQLFFLISKSEDNMARLQSFAFIFFFLRFTTLTFRYPPFYFLLSTAAKKFSVKPSKFHQIWRFVSNCVSCMHLCTVEPHVCNPFHETVEHVHMHAKPGCWTPRLLIPMQVIR